LIGRNGVPIGTSMIVTTERGSTLHICDRRRLSQTCGLDPLSLRGHATVATDKRGATIHMEKAMFDKRVVLITGSSRGIGAATARLFAQHGAAVAVNYRANASAAQSVVADIADAGGRAIAVQADVRIIVDPLSSTHDRPLIRASDTTETAKTLDSCQAAPPPFV